MSNTYEVICTRTGSVTVEAENPNDAMLKAETLCVTDIQWNDDFIVTDYEETE